MKRVNPRSQVAQRRVSVTPCTLAVVLCGIVLIYGAVAEGVTSGSASQPGAAARSTAQPDNAAFQEWWRELMKLARHEDPADGLMIRFRRTTHPLNPEERARQSEIIAKDPKHPLRRTFNDSPHDITHEYQIWSLGTANRANNSYSTVATGNTFLDVVNAESYGWMLTPDNLTIGDPNETRSDGRWKQVGNGIKFFARGFVYGGLSGVRHLDSFEPRLVRNQWSASGKGAVPSGHLYSMDAEGTWDPVTKTGYVTRVVSRRWDGDRVAASTTTVASGWRFEPSVQRRMAARLEELIDDGMQQTRSTSELLEIQLTSADEFQELIRIPNRDQPDIVRGDLTYTSTSDIRTIIPKVGIDFEAHLRRSQSTLIVLAWIVGGIGIVAAVIFWRIRR